MGIFLAKHGKGVILGRSLNLDSSSEAGMTIKKMQILFALYRRWFGCFTSFSMTMKNWRVLTPLNLRKKKT